MDAQDPKSYTGIAARKTNSSAMSSRRGCSRCARITGQRVGQPYRASRVACRQTSAAPASGRPLNPEGTILASAYREYPEILPRPNRVELDPNQVFSGILEVLNEVCEAVRDDPPRTLCMSTMGETFTPMDAEGNFLHNSIVSPDNRAIAQAESWAETLGFERVFEITGHSAHPSFTINKIMWIRDNMPDLHARTPQVPAVADAVMMRLGIEPRIDYTTARTMALDIRAKVWSDEMLTAGIDARCLRPIHSGSVPARSAPGAELTGLPVGCLVVAAAFNR